MRIVIAIIFTVVILAAYGTSLILPMRAVDEEHERPALALFGWLSYVLAGLGIGILLVVFTWARISGVSFDDGGNVGDIRCQRYESHFDGKTTTYNWATIPCVQIGKGG